MGTSVQPLPIFMDRHLVVGGGGVAAIVVLVLLVGFREGVAWLESPPGEVLVAQHPTAYQLGDDLYLLGYDLSSQQVSPGGRLELHLYWHAKHVPQAGYASFVHISTGGPPVAQSDRQNPGGVPSKEWTPEGYIYDAHVIYLPEWVPPGTYQVIVGLWTCDGIPEGEPCDNPRRPQVRSAEGELLGDSIALTTLTVE